MTIFRKKKPSRYADAPSFSDYITEGCGLVGTKTTVAEIAGKEIVIVKCRVTMSKKRPDSMCLQLQIEYNGDMRVLFTGSGVLLRFLLEIEKGQNPDMPAPRADKDILKAVGAETRADLRLRPFRARIMRIDRYLSLA